MFRRFYSPESDPSHKIMRFWFYYSIWFGFSFQSERIYHPEMICVAVYQFRKGISAGPALKIFYMIHRGGRYSLAGLTSGHSPVRGWVYSKKNKSTKCRKKSHKSHFCSTNFAGKVRGFQEKTWFVVFGRYASDNCKIKKIGTADPGPTWGEIFQLWMLFQRSKLKARTPLFTETW